VTSNPNAKKGSLSGGTVAYEINGEWHYGNGRKRGVDGKMSSYHCSQDNTIVAGPKPSSGGESVGGGSNKVAGGTIMAQVVTPQVVTQLRTLGGLTDTAQTLTQKDINDLYTKLFNQLPKKTA
jgi:hypothetical protein